MSFQVYSKSNCSFCVKAKKLLTDRGEDFTVVDISEGSIEDQVLTRERLIDRVVELTGNSPRTMPQIFVDGDYIGGYTDLEKYFVDKDTAE